jgi:DNA-binding Lrp family transcriptional regulator
MDDTDRKLLILIATNPRIHIQELAKRLGISKQAVHRRMQVLTEIGVIKGMIAGISIPYLDAVPVIVFGRSKTASIEETLDRLGESEFSNLAAVAGGNFLYLLGVLRNISELDSYAEFVKRVAEMPEPTVGIACLDGGLMPPYSVDGGRGRRKQSYKELSPLDLKIIASLKDNARRPIADIADMVGVTPKTVRRHLEDMISDGSLDMTVPVDLPSGGDMLLIMHVNLRDGADKGEVGRRLLSKHYFQDQYVRTFINLPGFLMWVFWSDKMTEIRKVLIEIGEDEDVLSVMLNFVYLERMYTTWRDKLPEVLARPSKKARTHNLHSGLRIE